MTRQYSGIVFEPVTARYMQSDEAIGVEHIHEHPIAEARQLAETPWPSPVYRPGADILDTTIPGGPTGTVRLRIVRPMGKSGALPAVVYLHGGGWILGSRNTYDRAIREIAVRAECAVVFVDYDRSPEFPFPVPVEQAYAVTQYVAEHSGSLNLDGRVAVMGDSAGGNMTAVVALLAKQRGGPTIVMQVMLYPNVDASMTSASYGRYADGPWLTRASMEWYWNAYAPDKSIRRNWMISPIEASLEQLAGLPPAIVLTAEHDLLVDEGESYARKLMMAGVPVTAMRYFGTTHGFVTLDGLAGSPAARNAMTMLTTSLRGAWEAHGSTAAEHTPANVST
ncbi:MAG TPA: alpha/beta hydrolase [Terriglobales bacterium]|nr:alpha/beta hydrolase [Terriglobales bacterium]